MEFSERPPSTSWTTVKYAGSVVAQVWFKPEGDPFALKFLIPAGAFQLPGMADHITIANLLKTANVDLQEVQSWRCSDVVHDGMNGENPELMETIPPPDSSDGVAIDVVLHSGPNSPSSPGQDSAITPEQWKEFASRWEEVTRLDKDVNRLRTEIDRLSAKVDSLWNTKLTLEDKFASREELTKWEEAKKRLPHLKPELAGFTKTWNSVAATSTDTKNRFEELIKTQKGDFSPAEFSKALNELESLRKNRQVWVSRGNDLCNQAQSAIGRAQSVLVSLKASARANLVKKRK